MKTQILINWVIIISAIAAISSVSALVVLVLCGLYSQAVYCAWAFVFALFGLSTAMVFEDKNV